MRRLHHNDIVAFPPRAQHQAGHDHFRLAGAHDGHHRPTLLGIRPFFVPAVEQLPLIRFFLVVLDLACFAQNRARARLEDFPPIVLAEAASALRNQLGAYVILRESARAAAAGSGVGGTIAAEILGEEFDSEAAAAIDNDTILLDLTPEEFVLGVLPIMSMALYVWFREHRPGPQALAAVITAAQATDLCPGGVFNLHDGLAGFIKAYAAARASDEDFNIDLVYHALARAVEATAAAPDTSRCIILDASGSVTDRWSDFAAGLSHTYLARCTEAGGPGTMRFTMSELNR